MLRRNNTQTDQLRQNVFRDALPKFWKNSWSTSGPRGLLRYFRRRPFRESPVCLFVFGYSQHDCANLPVCDAIYRAFTEVVLGFGKDKGEERNMDGYFSSSKSSTNRILLKMLRCRFIMTSLREKYRTASYSCNGARAVPWDGAKCLSCHVTRCNRTVKFPRTSFTKKFHRVAAPLAISTISIWAMTSWDRLMRHPIWWKVNVTNFHSSLPFMNWRGMEFSSYLQLIPSSPREMTNFGDIGYYHLQAVALKPSTFFFLTFQTPGLARQTDQDRSSETSSSATLLAATVEDSRLPATLGRSCLAKSGVWNVKKIKQVNKVNG